MDEYDKSSVSKNTAASAPKWIWIASIVILAFVISIVIYLAFLFIGHRGSRDFLSIDSCLDTGGRWNYETRTCER